MIKAINFKKVYKTQAESVTALEDVNFTIEDGELVALAGASGSGKMTLLNMIGTLDSINDGDIEFNGTNLRGMTEKEKTNFRKLNMGLSLMNTNSWEGENLAYKNGTVMASTSTTLADGVALDIYGLYCYEGTLSYSGMSLLCYDIMAGAGIEYKY